MTHLVDLVFLINVYGVPLVQTTSYLALHSSVTFGPDDAVICTS